MKIFIFFILISISKICFSKNLYYSNFYDINFKSNDIKNTKEEIINNIKLNSFENLIESILIEKEYKKIQKNISNDFVNSFLFSLNISEEKIINNKYSSKIQISYDYEKLIKFFIDNNYNFIVYKPEKFLIIIFDQNLSYEKLLSKDNLFYEYLNNNIDHHSEFVLPKLDFNDRYLITKKDFLEKKLNNHNQVISKYNSDNILLIHYKNNSDENYILSYSIEDEIFNLIDKYDFSNKDYKKFFNHIEKVITNEWKQNNLVISSTINKINCEINALNLKELKKIKELIYKNLIIKNVETAKISLKKSIYDITYYGKQNILVKSFNQNKINISFNNDVCKIKLI